MSLRHKRRAFHGRIGPSFSGKVKEFEQRDSVSVEDIEKEIAERYPYIESTNRNGIIFDALRLGGFFKQKLTTQ